MNKLRSATSVVVSMVLAMSALVLSASPAASAAGPLDILFVTANTSLPGGDLPIHDHLVAAGHTVTVVDDNQLTIAQTTAHDLAIVSTTVNPDAVGAKFDTADVPLITWERRLYAELGLVATNSAASETSKTKQILIDDPAHPIAAGLSGTVSVTTTQQKLSRGTPGAAATIVATNPAGIAPVVFTYDQGDTLADGAIAPNRRVAFFLSFNSALSWTTDAQAMFDAAVDWASASAGSSNVAPVVDAGPDQTIAAGDTATVTTTLTGTVTDDGQPVPAPTVVWTGPAGVTFADAAAASTTATFPGAGTYTLTLTADDTELTASDTVVVDVIDGSAAPDVLWVANKSTPTAGDLPGVQRLEAQGMAVTVVDDHVVTEADAIGRDLVVISSTVSPSAIDPFFATLPVPIFVWEAFVFDDLGFANNGAGQLGQASSLDRVDIEDPAHPAAGGLTGNPKVLNAKLSNSWAVPQGDADVIATLDNSTTRAAVFAYDEGAQMVAEPAPARRLGFFLTYSGPKRLTADGWTLWDASIDWALNGDEPSFPPVAALSADITTGETPLAVTFDASASSDPDDDIAAYHFDFGDGTSESSSEPTTTHTYTAAGSFTASVTVTDSEGNTDDATVAISATAGPKVWQHPDRNHRVAVEIQAGAIDRADATAVVPIDFTAALAGLGISGAFDPTSTAVTEVSADGAVLDASLAHQFDPGDDFEATTNAVGDIVIDLPGLTAAGSSRHVDVYFDLVGAGAAPIAFDDRVVVTTGVVDEGLSAIRFATAIGDWWYDETGGGFISLDDVDGNDWISHNAAAGTAGTFRGIPNAVHPDDIFSPGGGLVSTQVLTDGPLRSTIESTSNDGLWRARWDVYATHAEMTMLDADGTYWFQYEGTPGGDLQPTSDTMTRSNGVTTKAWKKIIADLDGEEWVYFSDVATDRSIFVSHRETDTITDHYKQLNGDMTVFAFGRPSSITPLLVDVPQHFAVGLIDGRDVAPTAAAIRAATVPMDSTVGATDTLASGPMAPDAVAVPSTDRGELPLAVTFDGSASSDSDGTIVSHEWSFGDGSAATGATASHTYTSPGVFDATLTVTDSDGLSATATVSVAVGSVRPARVTDGLIALYEFDETSGVDVADTSGFGAPLDLDFDSASTVTHLPGGGLRLDAPTKISSDGAATKVIDAIVASGELTVEAWVDPADLTQNGPARIVGISSSTSRRNVMLGQGVFGSTGDRVEGRVRTTTAGLNGVTQTRSTVGSLSDQLTHLVLTRESNGTIVLYIDAVPVVVDEENGNLGNWDTTMPLLIGAEQGGSRAWLGDLHLVAMYDRALTGAEVCSNRSAGPGREIIGANVAPTACVDGPTVGGSAVSVFDTLSFDAATSGDPDGLAVDYTWNFGDGTIRTGEQPVVNHVYNTDGAFTVQLTVTDDDGASTSTSVPIIVLPGNSGIEWTELVAGVDPRLPSPRPTNGASQQVASLVGDIDGDGVDDFVISDRSTPGPSVVWYQFIDETTGWAVHTIESDVMPTEAGGDIFDIDGDGDLDIALGGSNQSGDMWWWENPLPNASPTTEWTRHLIKSNNQRKHHDMRFGDFDDDGEPELAFWNQAPQIDGYRLFVAEIPNDPTTLWPTTEIYQAAEDSEGLDVADINNDGIDDIVGGGLWFRLQANGSFSPRAIDASRPRTRSVVGQLVPGGRPEVVIDSGDGIGPLSWYQWNDSTSSWDANELLAESAFGHSLRVGDVDGDGNLDIFTAEMVSPENTTPPQNGDATMQVFLGDGAGNFESQIIAVGIDNHESRLADVDGDGDLDIVGKPFNIGAPGLRVWLNEGVNAFGSWDRHLVDGERPWLSLFVEHADIDGDGYEDAVTGGWWYRNPGPAGVGGSWVRNTIGGQMKQMAAVGDLDGDGDVDVIGTSAENAQANADFHWARNDGSGNFTIFPVVDTDDSGRFLQGTSLARLTAGGPLELVLSWHDVDPGIRTIVVPSDLAANPSQAPWAERTLSTHAEGEQISVTDVDGDGDQDVITGTKWLRQNANGSFSVRDLFPPRSNAPDRIVSADMDGDGDLDAVMGFENGDSVVSSLSWFERPTDLNQLWTEHPISPIANLMSVDVADLDGDGDMDVVAGEHNLGDPPASRLFLFEQEDDGSFTSHLVYVGDEHHDGAQFVDLDLDGDLDIISIGFVQPRVTAYENTLS